MIATASGKVLPPVLNIVHYKLRITTVSVHLCVQILSAHLLWSISSCSSGFVLVSPSHTHQGKELILKALITSRSWFFAVVNSMPDHIEKEMTKTMKDFIWDGNKRGLMNRLHG